MGQQAMNKQTFCDILAILAIALIVSLIVIGNNAPHLPESGTGLNPCGSTPHCPTYNDNN